MDINNYTPKYGGLKGRSFYNISEYSPEEIFEILHTARLFKKKQQVGERQTSLLGKEILLVSKTAFTGVRIAFEIAVKQLCGATINLPLGGTQIEALVTDTDFLPTTGRYGVDGLVVCSENWHDAELLHTHAPFPVINAHGTIGPCIALAAMLTCWEKFGKLKELPFAIVGNMREHNFIMQAAIKCGMNVHVVSPKECTIPQEMIDAAAIYAQVKTYSDVFEGLRGCSAVFVTAGDNLGEKYKITQEHMDETEENSIFLHPMPVNRETEAEPDVCDGEKSASLLMAENLLHVQKAILALTIGKIVKD